MRMRAILLILALSAASGLAPHDAAAKGEYSRDGLHVSFYGTFDWPNYADVLAQDVEEALGSAVPVSVGLTGGFDMRAGYRFHPHVDFETGFDYAASYPVTVQGLGGGQASSWMYYASFRIFVLTEEVQPYLVLGMGAYHLDYVGGLSGVARNATDFAPRLGAGLDYYFDYRWGIGGEIDYVIGTRGLDQHDWLSVRVGAFYRF